MMRRPPIPGLVMADGWLQPYSRQIRDRQRLFDLKMKRIHQRAGSLEEYARGYRYYGFNRDAETGAWTYREWAPAARRVSLIGDFNGWNRESHPLERNERGVWEITLPPDALAHGQKVKVHVVGADGTGKDRIPAWITRPSRIRPLMISPGRSGCRNTPMNGGITVLTPPGWKFRSCMKRM